MEAASSINRSVNRRRGDGGGGIKEKRKRGNERKGKEKRKESCSFFLSSLAFRRSKLVEPRSKVRRFDEWATLQEVGILPTLVYL